MISKLKNGVDLDKIEVSEIRVSVLSNDRHLIYEHIRDNRNGRAWRSPLYVFISKNNKGDTVLQFEPLLFYSNMGDMINPIPRTHILATYLPAQEVIDARNKFIEDFQASLRRNQMSSAKMQATMQTSSGSSSLH